MVSTAIMVGSTNLAAQTFDIDGNGAAIAAGYWYLRHPTTAALSLIDEFADQMTAAGVAAASCTVRQNRRVRLISSGAFTVTWGTATILRDLLGFTQGDLSGQSSYTADDVSPLLWSPGATATPATIGSKAGYMQPHRIARKSDDGSRYEVDWYGSEIRQRLSWALIPIDRIEVDDDTNDGGTLEAFVEQVILRGYKFWHHEDVTEGTTDTNPMVWNDANAYGPYVETAMQNGDVLRRLIANADDYGGGVEMDLLQTSEYA